MVIIEVQNVAEPAAISNCGVSQDRASSTVAESNADAQSICNLTAKFDDRQDRDECNAYEMRAGKGRFVASITKIKNPEKDELRKVAGLVLDYETQPSIAVSFRCTTKYYNSII